MTIAARPSVSIGSFVLPSMLLFTLVAFIATETGVLRLSSGRPAGVVPPELVTIAPRVFSYRAAGDFLAGGHPVDGPRITETAPAPLEIMKFEVSAADYARCVDAGACKAADPRRRGAGNVPATGVSFDDATEYASWLSEATGETWRLPTIEEWAFAAGSLAVDQALNIETDVSNPAERWLAYYEKEAALGNAALASPRPPGSFGLNELGVADLWGSVWEWTATCASRTTFGDGGEVVSRVESCGVRHLEGRHRTAMSAFVRDPRSGGCSVGAPPDNLGFRLVRQRAWHKVLPEMLVRLLGGLAAS